MKYGEVNLGQIEAAINILGGEEGLRSLLSGELKVIPRGLVVLLVPDGSYSEEILPLGDPFVFYQGRGLYYWDGFRERIVSAARSIRKEVMIKEISRFRLSIRATGETLLSGYPSSVWSATDFCPWLAAKLTKMRDGANGGLRVDWGEDHFLVKGVDDEVHVVRVRWRPDGTKTCDLRCENLKYSLEPNDTFNPRN